MADVMRALGPAVEQYGDAGIRRSVALWEAMHPGYRAEDTLDALGEREQMLREWQEFLETRPLIVMPNSGEPAFRVGEDLIDEPTARRIWRAQLPQLAIPVLGLPAVSVPTGLHDGVPMGGRSEEHTSELQSLLRSSYAV